MRRPAPTRTRPIRATRTAPTTGRADAEGCTASATNEACSDGDGDGRCDGCGDCLHLHDRTYTCKDADVHTVTCADCNEVLGEAPHADASGNGLCDWLRRRCVQAHRA
ncbi:MAG: hypothetical protein ACLTDR_06065 [Adlercreutzia equolifaciens]